MYMCIVLYIYVYIYLSIYIYIYIYICIYLYIDIDINILVCEHIHIRCLYVYTRTCTALYACRHLGGGIKTWHIQTCVRVHIIFTNASVHIFTNTSNMTVIFPHAQLFIMAGILKSELDIFTHPLMHAEPSTHICMHRRHIRCMNTHLCMLYSHLHAYIWYAVYSCIHTAFYYCRKLGCGVGHVQVFKVQAEAHHILSETDTFCWWTYDGTHRICTHHFRSETDTLRSWFYMTVHT